MIAINKELKKNMDVFNHHIYEYKRGLRNLILHTTNISDQKTVEERLKKEKITYLISKVNTSKINVFFGNKYCIEILKTFPTLSLDKIRNEQDFILGIMLGYDRIKQCRRYLQRKDDNKKVEELIG
jgi:tRNA splicing ligase